MSCLEINLFNWQRTQKCINTLQPRQNGRHFPDDIFKCIFLNENVWISIKISLKFVPKGPINNIPALVHIMAWRRLTHRTSSPGQISFLSMLNKISANERRRWMHNVFRADSKLAHSQWETSLQSNAVSHWLGANLEWALVFCQWRRLNLATDRNWPWSCCCL